MRWQENKYGRRTCTFNLWMKSHSLLLNPQKDTKRTWIQQLNEWESRDWRFAHVHVQGTINEFSFDSFPFRPPRVGNEEAEGKKNKEISLVPWPAVLTHCVPPSSTHIDTRIRNLRMMGKNANARPLDKLLYSLDHLPSGHTHMSRKR